MYRGSDPRWILLGCVIPDLPWILQRAIRHLSLPVDPYDLRLYCIAQASLFLCLIAAGAFAALARQPFRTFLVLATGVIFHLGLDALETKWANGVHLLAPVSWEITNVGFFWPESTLVKVLTVAGLAYIAWIIWQLGPRKLQLAKNSPAQWGVSSALLALYIALPFAMMTGPYEADNHFVKTLKESARRTGKPIEFDRAEIVENSRSEIKTFAGEIIEVSAIRLPSAGLVSLTGRFLDHDTVSVVRLHVHSAGERAGASILGLFLLALLWSIPGIRRLACSLSATREKEP